MDFNIIGKDFMDDFYSSMKEILENSSNEKPTKVREAYSSSFFAEALVPLNPSKWAPYVAGRNVVW